MAAALPNLVYDQIQFTTSPGFPFFEQLAAFQITSLQITFNKKTTQSESEQYLEEHKPQILKAKNLKQLGAADRNDDSLFPFHHLYDLDSRQQLDQQARGGDQLTEDMSRGYYISNKDVLGLSKVLRPSLQELSLANCGMNSEQANILAF
jgi:hypothetical protein